MQHHADKEVRANPNTSRGFGFNKWPTSDRCYILGVCDQPQPHTPCHVTTSLHSRSRSLPCGTIRPCLFSAALADHPCPHSHWFVFETCLAPSLTLRQHHRHTRPLELHHDLCPWPGRDPLAAWLPARQPLGLEPKKTHHMAEHQNPWHHMVWMCHFQWTNTRKNHPIRSKH